MIEKEYTPNKQALKLKDLNFNVPCLLGFCLDGSNEYVKSDSLNGENFNVFDLYVSIPSFSQVFRWFREKYNLEVSFYRTMETIEGLKYGYQIERWESETTEDLVNLYEKSYEEAELACLKKLIEI